MGKRKVKEWIYKLKYKQTRDKKLIKELYKKEEDEKQLHKKIEKKIVIFVHESKMAKEKEWEMNDERIEKRFNKEVKFQRMKQYKL
uniref:Uncharacterized protein n=1 Tax=Romanomermis culicivorax TaxID=13658 RepID=A0A915J0F0_ROMCU